MTRESLRDPVGLTRLLALAQVLRTSRATAGQAERLLAVDANGEATRVARQLLVARGGSTASLSQADDQLRILRREALVAALVQRQGLRSASDLYEQYLIDPEVQPCLRTTPILQAVASVQLFIQRILHGIERDLTQGGELKRRWSWMRSYRVWEANRKVFLFPENWLFPELRDDKSSSFRLLESALGQGELNDEFARQAYGQFLDDVGHMAQVQVLGMYEDVEWSKDTGPKRKWSKNTRPKRIRRDLYVVGRTTNPS